ncbi:MAG TPA: transporter substrate-binding domain-containing protein [Kiritimatiellia bacterium]|nr:transporter substrate-binding domain-containing protein [Kiritimatiellia bacterium]HNS80738.1 transporter substrate-binding domain-containing protein [Kiritimatiellia bacterium]HPA77769.1 transporter substrate-binding domain-containing protein [Kiritimatiellia bacterium]HQQ04594.1 transporter substrate-binding domain-containing protein [Kiritimatiellia bacterium]
MKECLRSAVCVLFRVCRQRGPAFAFFFFFVGNVFIRCASAGPLAPDTITVVSDDNYPPFIFRDDGGGLRGILPDEWKLWEQKTGVRVNLMAMDWNLAQEYMRLGRADVLDTIFSNSVRSSIYDFTRPYADIEVPVFSHHSLGGFADIESLRGFPIGVKAGDACIDVLKAGGVKDFREYPSYEAIIQAASDRDILVFSVDKPPALYYLYKMNLEDDFRLSFTLYTGAFHRAVAKGRLDVLQLVEDGFAQITEDERRAVMNRWMGRSLSHPAYIRPLIYAILATAGFCAVLLVFNLMLRHKVEEKMADLKRVEQKGRESEETFRAVIESSPMGIYLYRLEDDSRLVLVGANPAADRIIGMDHSVYFGKTIEEVFPPLAKTEIPDRYRRAAQFGESWRSEQVDYDYGGIRGAFEVYAFQIAEGEAAVMFNEISERKQAEAERERLREQLAQAQKMESVGRLAGGVAHDFNNMLGLILGHVELAMDQLDPADPVCDELREIHNAAERSADLTRQLLAFARKQPIQPRRLDINATVEGLLKMLKRLIGENIELVWRPGVQIPPVMMDGSQIDHLLANLCVNARDAIADTGRITITTGLARLRGAACAAHPECAPGDYVELSVSDNGCGMDAEALTRLFEPFFTTKEVGRGTGLGLATVYGIVRQNHGFIDVDSRPGHGTRIRICLPRCDGDIDVPGPKERSEEAAPTGGATVLLVADEATILKLGARMLRKLGYQVMEADRPDKAMQAVREYQGRIDLLITDLVMPRMNGRELADQIRQLRPDIRVLFTSGYAAGTLDNLAPGHEAEISFLAKPFNMASLSRSVHSALSRKRSGR